ncbi:hypothetical protein F2981_07135 [Sinorhizobium meliloti]|nr:hypothetical protein [Sinorhizobium meliloti]
MCARRGQRPVAERIERTRGAEFAGQRCRDDAVRIWQIAAPRAFPRRETRRAPRCCRDGADQARPCRPSALRPKRPRAASRSSRWRRRRRPARTRVGGRRCAGACRHPVEARAVETAVSASKRQWRDHAARRAELRGPAIGIGRIEERTVASAAAKPEPKVAVSSIGDIAISAPRTRHQAEDDGARFPEARAYRTGRLDVNLPDDAPKTLLNELAVKLKEWTVSTGSSATAGAGRTDAGRGRAARAGAARQRCAQDPDVAAILAALSRGQITTCASAWR